MAKCRPSKWVPWAFLGAGLPFLAAWAINTGGLTGDVASRASQALSGNELTAWAKVESQGRDFVLQGTSPSQEALDAAVKSVAGTYGVRTVQNVVQIVEPVKMTAPTVESVNTTAALPEIKGTWNEGVATALAVTVAGATYKLGENPELSSVTGNWLLKPTQPLAEGSYDVTVESSDGKVTMSAATPGKLVVDLPDPVVEPAPVVEVVPLPVPTVENYFGNVATPVLKGTWPEVAAKAADANLEVKVGETAYLLGKSPELTSDGAGNWQLLPSLPLLEGEMNVMPAVVDKAGVAISTAVAAATVAVDVTPPALPEMVVPAADAKWPYAITGKWAEAKGNTLTAKVGERLYTVNRGAALTSDGEGNFTFAPAAKLAPGEYDIDFTSTDAAGNTSVQTVKAAIIVPEPVAAVVPEPEPAPVPAVKATIDAIPEGATWPYAITGTWDEKPGHGLSASVEGRTYVLGRGVALTSDGAGKFSFAPSAKFAPGKYDVVFSTTDATSEAKISVAQAAIVVPEPTPAPAPVPAPLPKLPAPTVVSQLDLTGAPLIKGTWPHDQATVLTVDVGGRNYVLGRDANISAKDSTWTLFPGSALADGTYEVKAAVSNAEGVLTEDETKDELVVDGTPPAAPTVMTMTGEVSPDHLSGTWDQANAKGLKISVPQVNLTAELGATASPLTADGAGNWRLNLAQPLPVGTYNVIAESTDVHGRVQTDVTEGEVIVAAKGVVIAPAAPYDCVAVMNRIGTVFPIRFEYDLTDITKPFDLSVSQYAALLKDPRCTSINVEVKGHADFRGGEVYNMGLSERRAGIIVKMLTDAGVEAGRLSVKALGESQPLDTAVTDEARTKNRRVEITAKP
jgi:outer membrane protein OmpA-like peptidoglycan-associated protein